MTSGAGATLGLSQSPDFIQFLTSSKPKFDCYFEVGNTKQGETERIGAVKLMLMAHSEVFRVELDDSGFKDKDDIYVRDIHPHTFKGMLKYVYGYDTITDMCFEDADNLFYVAEKYMIRTLKNKLAVRLMELLKPDNICSLLNNPAVHTHMQLNSTITKILRHETDHVLASPQFLWMNTNGFLKILEQDGLAVPEIELWRAAIKWAKYKADSEDGQMLRHQLTGLTEHLRLCTLTMNEVCWEVANTGVLTMEETGTICQSIGRREKPRELSTFSNETKLRKVLKAKKVIRCDLPLSKLNSIYYIYSSAEYNWRLLTNKSSIELLPLVCRSRDHDNLNPENWTYEIGCTTTVTKEANADVSSDNETSTLTFSGNVKCGDVFEIPLAVKGRNITLLPNSTYAVEMKLDGWHKQYYSIESGSGSFANDHLMLDIIRFGGYEFPSDKLQYRVVETGD